jgi:hypothetical protein
MKFSAIPVNVGDSFLLQVDEKTILVDGGESKKGILPLLKNEKIRNNHIDLLICTHYDADHINGILGILESKKYTFSEIWLPEVLGSLGYTLSKTIDKLMKYVRENGVRVDVESNVEGLIYRQTDKKNKEVSSEINAKFEDIDTEILEMIAEEGWISSRPYRYYMIDELLDIHHELPLKMAVTLKAVSTLIFKTLNSGAFIRWFEFDSINTPISYGFDMYSQNAVQTDITIYDEKLFFQALRQISLSKINKHSLVYMFDKKGYPNVLFTADSDLAFYPTPVQLKDNSIVTAPHHGAKANKLAYKQINGSNLVFVRSDRAQLHRPCAEYLNNPIRYCTICRCKIKQRVELTLSGNSFISSSPQCTC